MEQTMKILQITAPGQAQWRDAPVPEPGPGEVLIRVEAVNTCPHWDLHIMEGRPMFPGGTLSYPYTAGQPGHEAMGRVAAIGEGVEALRPDMEVAVWRDGGHHRPGCYAQYVVCPAENALAIPAGVRSEQVTSLELAMCVQVSFDLLARLDAVEGKHFGVSGLGPAGLVAVQMARAYGARQVTGLDPLPARRELALRLGAEAALPPDSRDLPGRTADGALESALDCTGLAVSIQNLMAHTRQVVAVFGVLREDVRYGAEHWPGLSLLGYQPHNRAAAERALALIAQGQLDLRPLATHTLPLSRYQEGVEKLRTKEAIKIRFLPWE